MYVPSEVVVHISKQKDREILARCRGGEVDAFEQIYAEYRGVVFRHALHMIGHEEDARDIRQETFIRAFQGLAKFRGDSSLKTWLLKICSNLCANRMRTLSRRHEVGLEPDTLDELLAAGGGSDGLDPLRSIERNERARTIWKVLNDLSIKDRQLIVLRDIEDLSYAEIAEIAGCSPNTLAVRLNRARTALRKRLRALFEEV